MLENARGIVDLGFRDLGYTIVTTDCGWSSVNRTATGQITWNPNLFPSGFPAMGEYFHNLGLKFGVYSGGGIWGMRYSETVQRIYKLVEAMN